MSLRVIAIGCILLAVAGIGLSSLVGGMKSEPSLLQDEARKEQIPQKDPANANFGNMTTDEKARIAEKMDFLMRGSAEILKENIAHVDIEASDGHLLVLFTDHYNSITPDDRTAIESSLAKLWRGTKYVREMGFSGDVTFIQRQGEDPKNAIVRTDRFTREDIGPQKPEPAKVPPTPEPVPAETKTETAPAAKAEPEKPFRSLYDRLLEETAAEEAKRKAEARKAEEEAAKKSAALAASLLKSGINLEKIGKTEGAMEFYEKVIDKHAETPSAKEALARRNSLLKK